MAINLFSSLGGVYVTLEKPQEALFLFVALIQNELEGKTLWLTDTRKKILNSVERLVNKAKVHLSINWEIS